MTKRQYIASGICGAALFVMLYAVPALAVMDNLLPAVIVCIACVVGMAITVFKGGLTDVSGK